MGQLERFISDSDWAVQRFSNWPDGRGEMFARGTALHFHDRLIQINRKNGGFPSRWIKDDPHFIELLYAMLGSFGMDRQRARLVPFSGFSKAVLAIVQSHPFQDLETRQVKSIDESWGSRLADLWKVLSSDGRIIASESIVVGASKVLHHLLPDLFAPIDRSYTLEFLNSLDRSGPYRISTTEKQAPDLVAFCKATLFYGYVSRTVPRIERYLGRGPMSGSIPKIIDNAVMAWWISG